MLSSSIRMAVVASDPLARAGLAALLGATPGFAIALQAHSIDSLTIPDEESEYDVILWDWGWDQDPPDAEENSPLPGLTVALVQEDDQVAAALNLGCRGILWRDSDEELLAAVVRAVASGLLVVDPALSKFLASPSANPEAALSAALTPRETEVLNLVAEGLTNKAIAQRLAISEHTVKFHVNAILGKLGAQSRTEAVVAATRVGLLSL